MFEGLLQPMHLVVILAIAVFVFGPKKLPELGKGLGEAIRGFKDSMKSAEEVPADGLAPKAAPPADRSAAPAPETERRP
jgi:sec-independent protein translocase protein TatA